MATLDNQRVDLFHFKRIRGMIAAPLSTADVGGKQESSLDSWGINIPNKGFLAGTTFCDQSIQ